MACSVDSLQPGGRTNFRAVVVNRAGPRAVAGGRHTLTTFTLMDHQHDTVNLTVWSSAGAEAEYLEQNYHVGTVVVVRDAMVKLRTGSVEESYDPVVTSPLKLKFSMGRSSLEIISGREEVAELHQTMLTAPPRLLPDTKGIALDDIRGPQKNGKFVSLYVAVLVVKPVQLTNGRPVREVRVMDTTAGNGVFKLWETEHIAMAGSWQPRATILRLADVLVEFDFYRGINVISGSSRSIITVNPNTTDAHFELSNAASSPYILLDRLNTFVAGSHGYSGTRQVTVSELNQLAVAGVGHEREALRYFVIQAKFSTSNLLQVCTMLQCGACGGEMVALEQEGVQICQDFYCENPLLVPSGKVYIATADIRDETGSLTSIEVDTRFMTELCGVPEAWEAARRGTKVTTARLFGKIFSKITVAVLLPVIIPGVSQRRPFQIIVATASI